MADEQPETTAPGTGPGTGTGTGKAKPGDVIVIKKYANRRLYNTSTSAYVTLEDLARMVREGTDFVVFDARTNEELTRQILTQIIFEEESRGEALLPVQFLRQLIGFYGGQMQGVLPGYLEMSLDSFSRQQEQFRNQVTRAFGATPVAGMASPLGGGLMEEVVKQNMAMFERALTLFPSFGYGAMAGQGGAGEPEKPAPAAPDSDPLSEMRAQMEEMRAQIDRLAEKSQGSASPGRGKKP